MVKLISWQ